MTVDPDLLRDGAGIPHWQGCRPFFAEKSVRVLAPLAGHIAALAIGTGFVLAAESDKAAEKPYTINDGKVDKKTYNGWRRYTESCMRCHGPDGAGSSYAPRSSTRSST